MILIGQYDSPFVRRVGIALTLYHLPYEHRPWSIFGDADKIRPYNPLTRVPTLVLDNGDVLIESHAILDYLDDLVGPSNALFPTQQPARCRAMKIAALASGLSDKAVSLFYERALHNQTSPTWENRCMTQIETTLSVLEQERAERKSPYWFGDTLSHADIAVACALRHMNDSHYGLIDMARFPALAAHSAALEAMPVFQTISQPFIPPA